MRPMYESANDLKNEEAVKKFIEDKHGVTLEKLPIKYRLDYAAFTDGLVTSFIEVKCRTFERNKYPSAMLSADKFMAAQTLMSTFDLPAHLVVRWTDCVGLFQFRNADPARYLSMGGRSDRGDAQDKDICVFIPVEAFTIL